MKKEIQISKTIRIWLSGKPKRIYRFDNNMVRCPKCKSKLDKELYNSTHCKICKSLLKPIKKYSISYNNKIEVEIIK